MIVNRRSTPVHQVSNQQKEQLLAAADLSRRTDRALDTGLEVNYNASGGGCGSTPASHFRVEDDQGNKLVEQSFKDRFTRVDAVSISGDGSMVVAHYDGYKKPGELIEIPLPGKGVLGASADFLRRHKLLPTKKLTQVPDETRSIDIGPDKQIAVGAGNELLVWTRRGGLKPVAQFDRPVQLVEYTQAGELLVKTNEESYSGKGIPDFYLMSRDGKSFAFVPEQDFDPDTFKWRLNEATEHLSFLKGSTEAQKMTYLESLDRGFLNHRNNDAAVSGDGKLAATWSGSVYDGAELFRYRFEDARVEPMGRLLPEDAPLSHKSPWIRAEGKMNQHGSHLVLFSHPDSGDQRQDLVVWDLDKKESTYLPSVVGARLENDRLQFSAADGRDYDLNLAEVPAQPQASWYETGIKTSQLRQDKLVTRDQVSQVRFVSRAPYDEQKKFLAHSDWLGSPERWHSHSQAPGPEKRVLVRVRNEGLFVYERASGQATSLGENTHPSRPDIDFSWHDWKVEFSPDERFALQATYEKPDQSRDLLVWDLDHKEKFLVPSVREHALSEDGSRLKFRALDGKSREVALTELGKLPHEDWYQRALLGMGASAADVGDIELEENGILVGDHFLERPERG